MNSWLLWLLAGAVLAAIGFFALSGLRSSIRPVMVFLTSWDVVIRRVWAVPRTVIAMAAVIASGAVLQLLSTAFPVVDERTMVAASIAWQGVMATALAAIAVNLHLFLIHDFFAARRFGAENLFYRGEAVNKALHPRPAPTPVMLRAAALGFAIWALTYGAAFAVNASVFQAPRLLPALDPGLAGVIVYFAAAFASFLILTLLSLVRPALSLGSKQPFVQGLTLAFRHARALWVMSALLFVAPAILGPLSILIPNELFPGSTFARAVGAIFFLGFSVIQALVVEVATVLFMNRAMNQSPDATPKAASAG